MNTKRDASNDTCRTETKLRDSMLLTGVIPAWAIKEFGEAADVIAKQRDMIASMRIEIIELRANISKGR
jgi:hypothetical protein